jgi:hypothetical protein
MCLSNWLLEDRDKSPKDRESKESSHKQDEWEDIESESEPEELDDHTADLAE